MKILKNLLIASCGLTLLFYSCSSDSSGGNNVNEELANQQNETENRIIPLSELTSGISIEGATTNTGIPPAPTNNIDFQTSTETQEAFQKSGFKISFSSSDSFTGAYLLLRDSDGNKAGSYFDIPLSAMSTNKNVNPKKTHKKLTKTQKSKQLTEDDFEIEVDFNSNVAAGQFCYEICLYDDNGNVSIIQTICVEVEAWGGNAEIVGEWVFDRYGDDSEENSLSDITCDNNQTLSVSYYKDEEESFFLVLNEDGTYNETYKGYNQSLNVESTKASCSAIYFDKSDYHEKYSGNWAYNEDKETLTIIDFKFEDLLDASNNEDYPNGYVYFDGTNTTAKVVSGELVITDTYTELQQTYTDIYIFKRR